MGMIAQVYVDKTVYHIDQPFDYLIPMWMQTTLKSGCRVLVPFGAGNRLQQGMVQAIDVDVEEKNSTKKMKFITAQIDEHPIFTKEQFEIAQFMVNRYFCCFYDVVHVMLPAGMQEQEVLAYQLAQPFNQMDVSDFSESKIQLLCLLAHPVTQMELNQLMKQKRWVRGQEWVNQWVKEKVVTCRSLLKQKVRKKMVGVFTLSKEWILDQAPCLLTSKQQKIVEFLKKVGTAEQKKIMYFCGVSPGVIQTLYKKDVLKRTEQQVYRTPKTMIEQPAVHGHLSKLTAEQQKVFLGIETMRQQNKPQVALLHGVTGSGKTQIFLHLIHQVVAEGKQAIMLVPEISLTPQMVAIFRSLFGERVGVLHSSLSLGEKMDEHDRMMQGKADIVVGTRSAVFAPFNRLGIIIMDEEGEYSYQSDRTPRYHTREIAKRRCVYHNAVLLLASATPSIESFYAVQKGTYHFFSLTSRYRGSKLPSVYLVDMKQEQQQRGDVILSEPLKQGIEETLKTKKQTILLINRRGYHTIAQCISCGQVVMCQQCDAAMTYHRDNHAVMCHLCGAQEPMLETCKQCGSRHLKLSGVGTQKLEQELLVKYPMARVLRMDADTTCSRYAYEEKLSAFSQGKYDILVGTQMVAKGLDFPNVTLVGVLQADAGLYAPDYRAVERVFSLLTQVVGRSGRGNDAGRAYIQSYQPDHPVFDFASKQNYQAFYQDEIQMRRLLKYPPFYDLCVITFSGLQSDGVSMAATTFLQLMKKCAVSYEGKIAFQVFGPFQAVMHKVGGKYREKILIKSHFKQWMRQYLSSCLQQAGKHKNMHRITLSVDINGDSNA